MVPDDTEFDSKYVHMYVLVDGQKQELHRSNISDFTISKENRKQRRVKTRNPRDRTKFYRKNQIRPWIE